MSNEIWQICIQFALFHLERGSRPPCKHIRTIASFALQQKIHQQIKIAQFFLQVLQDNIAQEKIAFARSASRSIAPTLLLANTKPETVVID